MYLFKYIALLTLDTVLFFFVIRGFIHSHLYNILRKRSRKRLKRNQTFKEWFLLSRYLEVLPKRMIIWYYSNFISSAAIIIIMVIARILGNTTVGLPLCAAHFIANGSISSFEHIASK